MVVTLQITNILLKSVFLTAQNIDNDFEDVFDQRNFLTREELKIPLILQLTKAKRELVNSFHFVFV